MSFQLPLFNPHSDWELPKELPDLSQAKQISLDIETCDPDLKEKGPGVRRGSYIVGISVAVPEGRAWYFPFGHSVGKQFDKDKVLFWAKKELCRKNQPKVGANLLYDLDFLYHQKVLVTGPFLDIQIAEPLIDENRLSYSLDSLSKDYLGETKQEDLMVEAGRNMGLKGAPQSYLYKLDPKFVGPYAEQDARLPLLILEKQLKKLEEDSLLDLFKLETKLVPMLLYMRRGGVRIDQKKLKILLLDTEEKIFAIKKKLLQEAGDRVDIWAAESIAHVYRKNNISFPLTPKTKQPSITKTWLENQNDPVSKLIMEARRLDKFYGTFLNSQIKDSIIDGRIHCQFHQNKSDDSGTVTGRFSSSNPNLQFIPNRDPEMGPLCRSLFIPEKGCFWGRTDYSQIEIRILIHYAIGEKSDVLREIYNNDPSIDYHDWCAKEAGTNRKKAKTINFGIIYGMGREKLSQSLGISFDEADRFLNVYLKELPFIRTTIKKASDIAQTRGYVRTLLNRRRRFDLWQPRDKELAERVSPSRNKQLLLNQIKNIVESSTKLGRTPKHGIERMATYKAFNAVDQGTAADIMKKAMVDIWESGVCDVLKAIHLTVHDELDCSVPKTKAGLEAFEETKQIMEGAVKLKVPVIVDSEIGPNWGSLKHYEREQFKEYFI